MSEDLISTRRTAVDWVPKTRRVIEPSWSFDTSVWQDGDVLKQLSPTVSKCRKAVEALRFDATALPLDDIAYYARPEGIELSVRMLVPDRNSSWVLKWIQVWRNVVFPWGPIEMNGPDYLVRQTRETIAAALAHEVDEQVQYYGARVFDPHRALAPVLVEETAP